MKHEDLRFLLFIKNLMLNKDNVNSAMEDSARDEQLFYIPRINHATAGKRGAILSWAIPQNKV